MSFTISQSDNFWCKKVSFDRMDDVSGTLITHQIDAQFKRPSKDEVKAIEVESARLLKESIKGDVDVDFDAENRRILNEYMIGWRGVDRATDSGNEPIAFSQQALSMLIDDALAAQEALLKAFMAAARGAKVKN